MKKITTNDFAELGSDKIKRRVLGRRHFYKREVTGVPVKESVEFRIIQKRKEIKALDAEWELTHPKPVVLKQAIAISLLGVTKYYRIEDKEAIIASKFEHTIVEVEENTQVIRFGF